MDQIENRSPQPFKLDDKASLEQVYKQYWQKLYIYAFNVLREKELCEDIVQNIFIDLWTRRNDVQISDLKSYLYQSVKHQIFNHFRKSNYKKELFDKLILLNSEYNIDELYEQKELKIQIRNAVSDLPEKRRIIFEMSRYEGISNKEISENLNISLQTVKNQISASLKSIRNSLKNLYMFFI